MTCCGKDSSSFSDRCRFTPRNDAVKIAAAVLLCLIITTTVVAKPYNCIPCKENNYCIKGIRYECPLDKPVTQGNRQTSEASCMTCVQRNGDETNPIFDPLVGDCVSCYEYSNGATPVWNGSACVACASGTTYDVQTGECKSVASTSCNANGVCTLTAKLNECESGYIAITTAEQLAKIGVDANYPLSGNYCLMNDISLSAYGENYNNGKGWTPIGNYAASSSNKFTGIFDGNGHEISDLYINREADYQGLFGYVSSSSGQIRNLGVVNVDVTGGSMFVGSLVGDNRGTITNSYAIGSVEGNDSVGGLVGKNSEGTISNSYATGSVTGTASGVGGLVGNNGGTISNSYATGSVTGNMFAGGLVGYAGGTISNSYATGSVTGNTEVGGLVGLNYGTISNSYFDISTTVMTAACGYNGNGGTCSATGKTTAEMQTPSTYSGWDTTIWELVQGQYPKLIGVDGQ